MDTEHLQAIRDKLNSTGQLFSAWEEALSDASCDSSGSDKLGIATVDVRADGEFLALAIEPGWKTKAGPGQLGIAVLEAYANAMTGRLRGSGLRFEDLPQDMPKPQPSPLRYETAPGAMEDYVRDHGGSWCAPGVSSALRQLSAEATQLMMAASTEVSAVERDPISCTATSGPVSVAVNGFGYVTCVTFNRETTVHTPAHALGTYFADALRRAQVAAQQRLAEGTASLVKLQALVAEMQDPVAFSRRLGVFE